MLRVVRNETFGICASLGRVPHEISRKGNVEETPKIDQESLPTRRSEKKSISTFLPVSRPAHSRRLRGESILDAPSHCFSESTSVTRSMSIWCFGGPAFPQIPSFRAARPLPRNRCTVGHGRPAEFGPQSPAGSDVTGAGHLRNHRKWGAPAIWTLWRGLRRAAHQHQWAALSRKHSVQRAGEDGVR
jgi:hypothetical protein